MANQYTFEFIRTDPDTNAETVTVVGPIDENTATFTPTIDDSEKSVKVRLTVTNTFGSSTQEQELGRCIEFFLPPVITDVEYDGTFIPGNTIEITNVTIEQGEPPYIIEYQFINSDGDILQDFSETNTYELQMSDLGKLLGVKILATDAGGRVSGPPHQIAELESVVATVNLDLEVDVDSDGVADVDDEDKVRVTSDITGIKKWILKYKR